jgi:hypothetical protein
MSSKFAQFLEKNKIDSRRLIAASQRIERLRPEDRALKLAKSRAKSGGAAPAAPEGDAEKSAPKKPRSGRPVTEQVLKAAEAGKPVPGPAKSRLLRALNHILTQKKQSPAELKSLF